MKFLFKSENQYARVTLTDVYFVPYMNRNLLCLGLIEKRGYSFVGKSGYLSIYNTDGKLELRVANQKFVVFYIWNES